MGWRAWALIGGGFASAVGDQVAAFAFVLYAVSVHSSGLLAAILVVELVPGVLLSLIGGVVTDRYARAWWWPAVLLGSAGVFAALGFVGSPVLIVALVGVSAALSSAVGSIGSVVLRQVTGETAWSAAARRSAALGGLATVLGTAFGGLAYATTNRGALMLVDAGTFVALAAIALVVLASAGHT